jgi:hypothetical protein
MDTYDLIRVKNVDDKDITLRGNTVYTIPVGGERIIPFTEAASWFGDPRLQDIGREQLRTMAWGQIQNLWGYTEGMMYLRDRWDPTQGFLTWDDFRPKVECYNMDDERVYFIMDDPEGVHSFAGPKLVDPAYQDAQVLNDRIAQNERELAELRSMLLERQTNEQTTSASAEQASFDAVNLPQPTGQQEVTEDAPRTVAARAPKK